MGKPIRVEISFQRLNELINRSGKSDARIAVEAGLDKGFLSRTLASILSHGGVTESVCRKLEAALHCDRKEFQP